MCVFPLQLLICSDFCLSPTRGSAGRRPVSAREVPSGHGEDAVCHAGDCHR